MLEIGGVAVQNVRETQPASRIVTPVVRVFSKNAIGRCKSSNQTFKAGKLYHSNKRMQ